MADEHGDESDFRRPAAKTIRERLKSFDATGPLPLDMMPRSLEAEFALLGALMYDGEAVDRVVGKLRPEMFSEPFHGRMFAAITAKRAAQQLADPVTLAGVFDLDPAFADLGGLGFLADLVDHAPPAANAPDYADVIVEAWRRTAAANAGVRLVHDVLTGVETSEAIGTAERAILDAQASTRGVKLWTSAEAVDGVLEELDNPNASPGISTGIEPLDEAIAGMFPGELTLLAGRPSMGKSALASCIALNVGFSGKAPDGRRLGVIEINGEMTPQLMMARHLTDRAFTLSPRDAPSYERIRKRKVTVNEMALLRHVADEIRQLSTLKSIKRTGLTLSALRGLVVRQRQAWEREGIALGLIILDHVGLIRSDREWRGRTEEQTNVAIELKELADELGVAILGLVQVNRQCESRDDKRPTLPDLKDSGAWEENADAVIGTYRDAYYANREQEPKKQDAQREWEMRRMSKTVEAIILKNRSGATGTVALWGDMPRNAIRARAPDNMYGGLDFGGQALPSPAQRPEPPISAYEGPDVDPSAFE